MPRDAVSRTANGGTVGMNGLNHQNVLFATSYLNKKVLCMESLFRIKIIEADGRIFIFTG